jgi:mannose-6-phosphate isomerase
VDAQHLYVLEPQSRERVWGGQRLMPQQPPIGEIWCAYGKSRVQNGPAAGRTVEDLTRERSEAFVGRVVAERFPESFPLLIKLLDCADWLSVQVHPNDEQAARLEGPGYRGKTEAWHFIDAAPGAQILAGVRPGTSRGELARAIRTGRILDVSPSIAVHPGETYLLHAGTMHALGPGLLLYEVQQSSDITYRVYDWDRPASAGRELHIEQAVAVTDPERQAIRTSPPTSDHALSSGVSSVAVGCSYFVLDVLNVADMTTVGDTEGTTFHVLTVKSGTVEVRCGDETICLKKFETAVVAGATGNYELRAVDSLASVLRARVPER